MGNVEQINKTITVLCELIREQAEVHKVDAELVKATAELIQSAKNILI
ncbi:hypothetical protein [Gordoniibacillus kamchatkensis]|nr:hypothetical protein [Paenibacillus sp. VKM B-2647]